MRRLNAGPVLPAASRPARATIVVGTAGWSIPRGSAHRFAQDGTHLRRYGRVFGGAEINSSFHRPHTPATYARWAESTPADFRFSVKVPRTITHDRRLRRVRPLFDRFLEEIAGLAGRRGPLLVQLPPSLEFDARVAARFFDLVRSRDDGLVVCEPRHATWFSAAAETLLVRYQVGRVAADPIAFSGGDAPGGWNGIVYYRLHGAPRKYWSRYEPNRIAALADVLRQVPASTVAWCVFDNTASGAALENAWELQTALAG